MSGARYYLAGTDHSVDAIVGRMLDSHVFPAFTASAYQAVLDSLAEHHRSTTAFMRQLQWLLLHHFRTAPLSFLLPLDPLVPAAKGVSAIHPHTSTSTSASTC